MKDYSVSQIKKRFRKSIQQLPKEGSKLRAVFDAFNLFKGHIIDFEKWPNSHKLYEQVNQLR